MHASTCPQLLRLGTGAVLMLGYLERQDPFAMAFFGPEWKRAYCVLSAVGVFSHHGSHKEISFNPRGFAEVKVRRNAKRATTETCETNGQQ